jgi:3-dehydroquinate synthase
MRGPAWPSARYIELMSVDKKAERGTPRFVLLERLGGARVQRVPDAPLTATLAACTGVSASADTSADTSV